MEWVFSVYVYPSVLAGELWWVAQVRNPNMATQARSKADVLYDVSRMLVGHLAVARQENLEPFANMPGFDGAPPPDAAIYDFSVLAGFNQAVVGHRSRAEQLFDQEWKWSDLPRP